MQTKEIILCRGRGEDISWLKQMGGFIHHIYNRGDIKDVGREVYTYLYHIVNEWDNLADINIFSQANPFDHCTTFIEKVKNIELLLGKAGFRELGDYGIEFDKNGMPHHGGLPIEKVWRELFGTECPQRFKCKAAGIFAVKRNNILKRDRAFYEKAIRLIDYTPLALECYCLERLWHKIFE